MIPIQLYIDSANEEEVRKGVDSDLFGGLTTNPCLVMKETTNYEKHIELLLKLIPSDWEMSVMATGFSAEEVSESILRFCGSDNRIRVKVPGNRIGTRAAFLAAKQNPHVRLNYTCVLTPTPTIFLRSLITRYPEVDAVVSVFCERQRVQGLLWQDSLRSIAQMLPPARLLACSLKTAADLWEASFLGAGILTAPLSVYEEALGSCVPADDIEAMLAPFAQRELNSA